MAYRDLRTRMLHEEEAAMVLGFSYAEQAATVAVDALASGLDAPALAQLAMLRKTDSVNDALALLRESLAHYGLPPHSTVEALPTMMRRYCRQILDGTIHPLQGADAIWWNLSNHPDALQLGDVTAFIAEASSWEETQDAKAREQIEDEIWQEARRYLEAHPDPFYEPPPIPSERPPSKLDEERSQRDAPHTPEPFPPARATSSSPPPPASWLLRWWGSLRTGHRWAMVIQSGLVVGWVSFICTHPMDWHLSGAVLCFLAMPTFPILFIVIQALGAMTVGSPRAGLDEAGLMVIYAVLQVLAICGFWTLLSRRRHKQPKR